MGITPELGLILSGSPDAKSTEFGDSCKLLPATPAICRRRFWRTSTKFPCQRPSLLTSFTQVIEMRFETGEEKLKSLETGVFVGAGRFVVEEGKPVVVEYKLSKVVQGST